MSTGGFTRAQHPWIDDDRLPHTDSEVQERGPLAARKKVRKKSIRNAKDSAEMARIKYLRKYGHDAEQSPQSSTSKLGRHFGLLLNGNNSSVNLSNDSRDRDRDHAHAADTHSPVRVNHVGHASYPNHLGLDQHSRLQTSPLTPPATSEAQSSPTFYWHDGLHESAAALTRQPSGPTLLQRKGSFDDAYLMPGKTSSENTTTYGMQDDGLERRRTPSFGSTQPIITRRSPDRPRTAGDYIGRTASGFHAFNSMDSDLLEVPIPHYRLGTPQFSERGTVILNSTLPTPLASTVDLVYRPPSDATIHRLFPASPEPGQCPMRRSPTSWFSPSVTPAIEDGRPSALPDLSGNNEEVLPSVFDKLCADPDSPAWVTYTPGAAKRELMAATIPRLMMEITSVRFLDYELLSDFFLTYRTFMTPAELARYLFARLRWAVSQSDATGRIVRVRTFVALRHWVLNYFLDDFESDFMLRNIFCDLVNKLSQDLQQRPGGPGGDLQVLNELKKCWKRTCALIWESEETTNNRPSLVSPNSFQISEAASSDSGVSIPNMPQARTPAVEAANAAHAAHERETILPSGQSYFGPSARGPAPRNKVPESPFSDTSAHVTSCSIPMRKRSRPNFKNEKQMEKKEHPPLSQSPRKPQRRPSSRHQRSSSFSDALRDDRAPIASETFEVSESPETFFRGELIKGTLIPPNSANVVIPGPMSPMQARHQSPDVNSLLHPDALHNPAVMKLLGGVRRALSTRHASKPGAAGHKPSSSGDLRRLRASQSLVRPATVMDFSTKRDVPRSDALAALVARSWEEQPRGDDHDGESVAEEDQPPLSARSQLIPAKERPLGPIRFNSHVTTRSRSILIVDDTGTTNSSPAHSREFEDTAERTAPLSDDDETSRLVRELAINNTASAFYLPDHQSSLAREYQEKLEERVNPPRPTTPGATSILSAAPLSPPPTVPLPPLPPPHAKTSAESMQLQSPKQRSKSHMRDSSDTTATHLSQIGLAIGTPIPQGSPSSHNTDRSRRQSPGAATATTAGSAESETNPTPRLLRRRPGGNLRAVDTVQALDIGAIRRRQSTGSVNSPSFSSPSLSASGSPVLSTIDFNNIDAVTRWPTNTMHDNFTDSQIGASGRRRSSLKLLSTHSSQPNLRPSFEAEVRRLASLPADEDDDGDIEATLLKLEGRYMPSRQSANMDLLSPSQDEFSHPQRSGSSGHDSRGLGISEDGRFLQGEEITGPVSPNTETQGASIYNMSQASHETVFHKPDGSVTPDHIRPDDDVASPQSDREVKRWRRSSRVLWTPEPLASSSSPRKTHFRNGSGTEARDFAGSLVSPTALTSHTRGSSNQTNSSFLLDDNESLLDAASIHRMEKVLPAGYNGDAEQSFFLDEEDDEEPEDVVIENAHLVMIQHPPTPPTTAGASSDVLSVSPAPSLLSPGPQPGSVSKDSVIRPGRYSPEDEYEKQVNHTPRKHRKAPPARLHLPRHIPTHHTPFILAYKSSALAAQCTLIEKDALDCIDWKDLVNLSWSQSTTSIRDWAQFTHSLTSASNKISSVDLIISRFNLVIKWCISSVLLCATPSERATCITKFIHVATHSHKKLRNFATAAQITIGLMSSDLAKLSKTWELVPQAEEDTLEKLEQLVSPVRNFAALRAEMESAAALIDDESFGDDKGVIPFLGVYTRDLMLNAQKPATVGPITSASFDGRPIARMMEKERQTEEGSEEKKGEGEEEGEMRLINFERYRTAATIVKGVLRLLDASSRYTIKPDREVLSRCLWLAALGDGELGSLSRGLE